MTNLPGGLEGKGAYVYVPISADQVPDGIVFTTPRRNQGQSVEVSYAAWSGDADEGDPYMRATDEDRVVTYYQREESRRDE